MKRIQKIEIKNFKAFREEQLFDLNGKNVLIFGNNGSGKSSLFWALYTFLQSSIKKDDEIKKYFEIFDESNTATHESLKNMFESDTEDSFIKVTTIDDKKTETYTISKDTINTNLDSDTSIREANLVSDFINHKLLHNFYNVSHRIETNLWPVFERDIFPFITVDDDVFSDKIKRIKEAFWKTSSGRFISGGKFAIANGDLDKLNSEIDSFLQQIENTANEFIKKHFYSGQEKLKIHLEYKRKLNFDQIKNEKKKNKKPDLQIKLWVELKEDNSDSWKTIQRPHSFLHESFLSRIAFAIRIGALRLRPSTDKSFQILVLDDMLISLDMSNRMQLIKVLLNRDNSSDVEYFDNFQKIIMTHDKGFYEIIKRYTNPLEWEYFDFRKDENTNNAPVVTIDKSHIEKARAYLSDGQYELCGSELRKEAEGILSKFLKGLNNEYESEFKPLASKLNSALNKVIEDERGRFRKIFVDRDLSINILKKLVSTVFFKR